MAETKHTILETNFPSKLVNCTLCGWIEWRMNYKGVPTCSTPSKNRTPSNPRHLILEEYPNGLIICKLCGPQKGRETKKDGVIYLRCPIAHQERMNKQYLAGYRKVVQDRLNAMKCEECGFNAKDICQLDVDHIIRRADGGTDHPDNLKVLCANCHRLKTKKESTGRVRRPKIEPPFHWMKP